MQHMVSLIAKGDEPQLALKNFMELIQRGDYSKHLKVLGAFIERIEFVNEEQLKNDL